MERRARRKKRGIGRYILIAFLVIILGIIGFGIKVYLDVASTARNIYDGVETEDVRGGEVDLSAGDPISILLLGIDDEELDSGRSDSIIVATVNPKQNSTKMLSIPRDTRTEIVGRGTVDKINHAYAFGGVEMSINTVQNFLDIPIDFYVEINMQGIQELVDVVGGIEVNNTLEFSYGGSSFSVGTLQLNGEEALNYARMRKEDPRGDFGRQERQRQVVEGIVRKIASFSTVTRYNDILNAVEGNMRTNVSLDNMIAISRNYMSALDTVDSLQLEGTGQRIDGVYYQIISDAELTPISTELREHLVLE